VGVAFVVLALQLCWRLGGVTTVVFLPSMLGRLGSFDSLLLSRDSRHCLSQHVRPAVTEQVK
jgi:hypothetical protein